MNNKLSSELMNEVGKNVHEFFMAEIKLNSSSPIEAMTLMIGCSLNLFVSALKSGAYMTDKTLYELYEEIGLDIIIRGVSQEMENNK